MIIRDMTQVIFYFSVLLLWVKPLGWMMAQIYEGKPCGINQLGRPLERFVYWIASIDETQSMDWKQYLKSLLYFNLLGILWLYALQRLQTYLPLNPEHFSNISPALAFNTAISFSTNTDWQAYSGESTMSYLTQMGGMTVQNFLSAATGMSVLIALIRGLRGSQSTGLGNFWVDIFRSGLYILLPLSFILSIILASQGVIQNIKPYERVVEPSSEVRVIPMGPVASQVAIKQLGTNGGGFFGANSAYPFENPNPLSNFLEMLAILLIPAALCYTFGMMVNDKPQGWAILGIMFMVALPCSILEIVCEQQENPALTQLYNQHLLTGHGNMEGKELRFGVAHSALWTSVSTAASNGSTNSSLGAYMPLGSLIPLVLMQLGEVIFGGVGSGLYGMVIFIIIALFVAGLMVGRTPEYLGKKIDPFEMKMAAIAVLIMPLIVLLLTATSLMTQMSEVRGPHGLTQILYAFTSITNNNGSTLDGLDANTFFYNTLGGMAMLTGRYVMIISVLAIAGSFVQKRGVPKNLGTLDTYSPLFSGFLIAVIFILGSLSFFPVLALGPILEHLILWEK